MADFARPSTLQLPMPSPVLHPALVEDIGSPLLRSLVAGAAGAYIATNLLEARNALIFGVILGACVYNASSGGLRGPGPVPRARGGGVDEQIPPSSLGYGS